MKEPFVTLAILLSVFLVADASTGAPTPADSSLATVQKAVGANIVSLAEQSDGTLWFGTEGRGVVRFDPRAVAGKEVTSFRHGNAGLGDDCAYAMCVDLQNRVWVGHLNHGVSVYNGQKWQNYDVLQGPVGERVYAVACSAKDGSVWMATSAGLTRYLPGSDSWQSFTRQDGLPEDQATALAVDRGTGDLLVGFKTQGISVARWADSYQSWSRVGFACALTPMARGSGLSTGMINDVLITKQGVYVAATTAGLCVSSDHGVHWSYTRGADWPQKVKQSVQPITDFKPPQATDLPLLPEDYISCLAEQRDGQILLGFWHKGLFRYDLKTEECQSLDVLMDEPMNGPTAKAAKPDDINRMLVLRDGRRVTSVYGMGLSLALAGPIDQPIHPVDPLAPASTTPIALPTPVSPPSADDVRALERGLSGLFAHVPPAERVPKAVLLPEDWKTEGEFLGRRGRYWACLSAMRAPLDLIWGAGDQPVAYHADISRHHQTPDWLRYWVNDLGTTRPGTLELPLPYLHSRVWRGDQKWSLDRRQAEWDDHGEGYSSTFDGPHVRCNVTIPPGSFILSYYNLNKDGQHGPNRFRDYRVTLREHRGDMKDADADFATEPELSATRTTLFCGGGVYSNWLVRGPTVLALEINRNNSFNTIVAGIMLDEIEELPAPYLKSWQTARDPVQESRFEDEHHAHSNNLTSEATPAYSCLELLRLLEEKDPADFALVERKSYLTLALFLRNEVGTQDDITARQAYRECLYHLSLYPSWETLVQQEFKTTPRTIEKSIRMQADIAALGNSRELVERYAGLKPIHEDFRPPPKNTLLSATK